MLCLKFGWNWPSGYKLFSLCHYYLPLERAWAWPFIWTNLNPLPITQGCFVPSRDEIGPEALEKKQKWEKFTTTTSDKEAYSTGELKRNGGGPSPPCCFVPVRPNFSFSCVAELTFNWFSTCTRNFAFPNLQMYSNSFHKIAKKGMSKTYSKKMKRGGGHFLLGAPLPDNIYCPRNCTRSLSQ